jgi:hypothetical protein
LTNQFDLLLMMKLECFLVKPFRGLLILSKKYSKVNKNKK